MAGMKKLKKPQKINNTVKEKKPRQGHKLVWITLIIIAIPCIIVAYVLLTSMGTQNKPVVGNRFSSKDLDPEITDSQLEEIENGLSGLDYVQSATVDLKSATVRILIDVNDDATNEVAQVVINAAYDKVNSICPIDTYFTNKDDSKMYDLEINVYNYIVDDAHSLDGQIYLELTKTGAGDVVVDNMRQAKNQTIVDQIRR